MCVTLWAHHVVVWRPHRVNHITLKRHGSSFLFGGPCKDMKIYLPSSVYFCIWWRRAAVRAWSTVMLLFLSCLSNGAANHPFVQAFMAWEGEDKVSSTLELRGDSDAIALIWERCYERKEAEKESVWGWENMVRLQSMCVEIAGVALAIFVYRMHSLESLANKSKGDSACVNTVTAKHLFTHSVAIPAVCCCLWRHEV